MFRKVSLILGVFGLASAMFLSGCGETAQLNLTFNPQESATYQASSVIIKDFRFEQPNLDKLREEQTKTATDLTFTQTIESVDADGVATAKITIDGLKIDMVNKNEVKYAFDSQKEEDQNAPMAKLLGQSYTIKITPEGTVTSVDTRSAVESVTGSYEKQVVQSLLNEKTVKDRHEIAAMPNDQPQPLPVDSTWTKLVPSPPGLLTPKTFEKTYTLTSVDDTIATVSMQAAESGEQVAGQPQTGGGMGIFANMFDNIDDYTGSMRIDMSTGKVLDYDETLISTYTAEEMPQNGDPEKGPDTLTMRFTHRVHLEKLN